MNYFSLRNKIKTGVIGTYPIKKIKKERNKIYFKQALVIALSGTASVGLSYIPFAQFSVGLLICVPCVLGIYGVWYYNDLKKELNRIISSKKQILASKRNKSNQEWLKEHNEKMRQMKLEDEAKQRKKLAIEEVDVMKNNEKNLEDYLSNINTNLDNLNFNVNEVEKNPKVYTLKRK